MANLTKMAKYRQNLDKKKTAFFYIAINNNLKYYVYTWSSTLVTTVTTEKYTPTPIPLNLWVQNRKPDHLRIIHKPRGQLRVGRGVSQMTILSHKPYLGKVTTKEGGQKNHTWFMDDPLEHLSKTNKSLMKPMDRKLW